MKKVRSYKAERWVNLDHTGPEYQQEEVRTMDAEQHGGRERERDKAEQWRMESL